MVSQKGDQNAPFGKIEHLVQDAPAVRPSVDVVAQGHQEVFRAGVDGVPARNTAEGIRAVVKGRQVIEPESVRRYLDGKLGDDLVAVRTALTKLARAYRPRELGGAAYPLYEQFRPDIPEGQKGGAKGVLDLARIEALANRLH